MHPFLDFSERLALVANGVFGVTDTPEYIAKSKEIMDSYLARGLYPRSAIPDNGTETRFKLPDGARYHGTESYALRTGEFFEAGSSLCASLAAALSERPNGIVAVAIHADEPDKIAIGKLDRPMSVGIAGEDTYIATTQFGFPADVEFDTVVQPPEGVICAASAGELTVTRHRVKNMRMERVTAKIYHKAYGLIEEYLKGQKDTPKNLWDLERMYETEWRELWKEPYCDCVFARENALFKPCAELSYNILFAMEKEGKLRKCLKLRGGRYPMYHFYLE